MMLSRDIEEGYEKMLDDANPAAFAEANKKSCKFKECYLILVNNQEKLLNPFNSITLI